MRKIDAILFLSLTGVFASVMTIFFIKEVSWQYYAGAAVSYWIILATVSTVWLEVWHKYEQLKIEHKKEQKLKETYLSALNSSMER